jgi:hypothetical protein
MNVLEQMPSPCIAGIRQGQALRGILGSWGGLKVTTESFLPNGSSNQIWDAVSELLSFQKKMSKVVRRYTFLK